MVNKECINANLETSLLSKNKNGVKPDKTVFYNSTKQLFCGINAKKINRNSFLIVQKRFAVYIIKCQIMLKSIKFYKFTKNYCLLTLTVVEPVTLALNLSTVIGPDHVLPDIMFTFILNVSTPVAVLFDTISKLVPGTTPTLMSAAVVCAAKSTSCN